VHQPLAPLAFSDTLRRTPSDDTGFAQSESVNGVPLVPRSLKPPACTYEVVAPARVTPSPAPAHAVLPANVAVCPLPVPSAEVVPDCSSSAYVATALGKAAHVPPEQEFETQSEFRTHFFPLPHRWQLPPPQSTSVSLPSS